MTLEDVVDFAAALGLPGVELTGYYFPQSVQEAGPEKIAGPVVRLTHQSVPDELSDLGLLSRGGRMLGDDPLIWMGTGAARDYVLSLAHRCFVNGLTVSGTAIGNDFALPDGDARRKQIQHCLSWIDVASVLGAPVIRIFAGKVPKGGDEDEAVARCAAGINECLPYAAYRGVHLALENHGGITATPAQMLKIIERVDDSPYFGVNFDSRQLPDRRPLRRPR